MEEGGKGREVVDMLVLIVVLVVERMGRRRGGGGTATLMLCEVKEGERGGREGGALKSALSQAAPRIARSVLSAK